MQTTKPIQQQSSMGIAETIGMKPTLPPEWQGKKYILMTYRSGIVPVEKTTYYKSDSGWGCMLRVAQMFVANLLTKEEYHVSREAIVRLFYDNLMVPFSIQMFTKVSAQLFPGMKPYAWFTPCQAGFLVKNLLQNFDTRYKVVICNDGAMFLDDIRQGCLVRQQEKKQDCTKDKQVGHQNKFQHQGQLVNEHCGNQHIESDKKQKTHPEYEVSHEPRVVVLLMARIGLDSPEQGYLKCVSKFMQNRYFVSIMGGTPKHAHLFIEHFDGYYGFLDPHTTRPVVSQYAKMSQYMDQYTSKLQWISQSKIDSSMCIGFCFLQSQMYSFWQSMLKLKEQLKEDFFVYLDEKRPDFDENAIIEIGGYSDEENGQEG